MALPRAETTESPKSAMTTVTGESFGISILSEARGSSGPCWAKAAERLRQRTTAALLHIDIVNRHLPGLRVDVAGPERSLGVHYDSHIPGFRVPQAQHAVALPQLDPSRSCLEDSPVHP